MASSWDDSIQVWGTRIKRMGEMITIPGVGVCVYMKFGNRYASEVRVLGMLLGHWLLNGGC